MSLSDAYDYLETIGVIDDDHPQDADDCVYIARRLADVYAADVESLPQAE